MATTPRPHTYAEFWPRYLALHRRPLTRMLHFLGGALGILLLAYAGATLDWRWAVAAPVAGYALAWLGHALVEGNRPATFGHPLWSFLSEYRMLGLWLAGRLQRELARHNIERP